MVSGFLGGGCRGRVGHGWGRRRWAWVVQGRPTVAGDGDDSTGHGAASGSSGMRVGSGWGRLVMGMTARRAGRHKRGWRRWEQRQRRWRGTKK
jgi:hypothetical protein